jgi:hypothetical protein
MKKLHDIQLMNGFSLQANFGHSQAHSKILLIFKLYNNFEMMKR